MSSTTPPIPPFPPPPPLITSQTTPTTRPPSNTLLTPPPTTPLASMALSQPPHSTIPIFTPLELMTFGGISGCVAKTLIAPADNIKILYQVNPQNVFSLRKAATTAHSIAQDHGLRALWRGNSATLLRVFPYASINYTAHEFYFLNLQPFISAAPLLSSLSSIQQDGISRFIAGGLAGTTSTLVTYPLDVFRARLAASIHAQHPGCSTYGGTIRNVINTLGFKGIFSGLAPTLLGIFPYNGISFATYHTLKRMYINRQLQEGAENIGTDEKSVHENRLPVFVHLTCGAVAALIGQSLTYPLDVVRRRKQVGVMANLSFLQCLRYIYSNEGLYGFFRGLTMNWVKGPIATATSFVVNDRLKHFAELKKKKNNKD